MNKLTPWFHGSVKPVRVGVYERKPSPGTEPYSYWNGEFWASSDDTPERAAHSIWIEYESHIQNLSWRGLTKRGTK